jgi:glycosyltransferase involved in cell wall biosynthesis
MPLTLSIIIPVYNEVTTIEEIVDRVIQSPLPDGIDKQIIVVDDASTDGTRKLYPKLKDRVQKIHLQKRNQGKGAAIRKGLEFATGDFLIIQDADLEYDPNEYQALMKPLLQDKADVVYGSRFMGDGGGRRVLYFWHMIGNKGLTLLSNMFTNLNLTDMETCYKMFRASALKGIKLEQNRFGFEPEITAKLAKKRVRFFEIGVSYNGRTYDEGKKIGLKDAFNALYCIIKYSLGRSSDDVGRQTLERLESYKEYAEYLFGQFEPHLGKRVLEFGSGIGSLARMILDRERIWITDFSADYVEELKRSFGDLENVQVMRLDMTDPPKDLYGQGIDTIFSSNVLEHIEKDDVALKNAYELLAPGGKLLLLVPAFNTLYSPMDANLDHFRRYDKRMMTQKLRAAGFEVEDLYYLNMIGAIGWYVCGVLFRQSEITDLNILVHKIIDPITRFVDALFGNDRPFGLSLVAVAKKPK